MRTPHRPRLRTLTSRERRWDLYPRFLRLMRAGYRVEALLLILSTWNFARFRYALRSFRVDRFEQTLRRLEPTFRKFYRRDFATINFPHHTQDIKHLFTTLANIKGIEKTGAPKLMHLKAPRVFVMWDGAIRRHYGCRRGDAADYVTFLKLMQARFGATTMRSDRTLPKLIDEHNFLTITRPMLRRQ